MKLPGSQDEWTAANDFVKMVFGNAQLNQTSIDSAIEFMNNTIYDYFTNLCGTVNSNNHSNEFFAKYKHLTTKQFKYKLKHLKMNHAPFP